MTRKLFLSMFLFVLLIDLPVHADVVAVGGAASVIPIPPGLGGDVFESDTTIAVFYEQQALQLNSLLSVDATLAKLYVATTDLDPATIPAGTVVNSYLVHFDRVGQPGAFLFRSGSVTLDQPVLGLISTRTNLLASDAILGIPTTTYAVGSNRGVELTDQDSFQLSSDLHTVSFTLGTSVGEDQLRIVTAVPEPSTAELLCLAVVSLSLFFRYRERQNVSPVTL